MEHEAVDLIRDSGRITGVQAKTPSGTVDIRADLVVGCDGRHSTIRKAAGLEVIESGVPIDVLWFRISRTGNDPEQLFGNINYGKAWSLFPAAITSRPASSFGKVRSRRYSGGDWMNFAPTSRASLPISPTGLPN